MADETREGNSKDRARAIPERSSETWAAVRLLQQVAELDVVKYEVIRDAIGCDPQADGRHYVARACEILAREEGIEFAPVPNVGLKRADDVMKVALGRFRMRKAGRQARRARRALAAVEGWEKLTDDQKREHNVLFAQTGALEAMASSRASRKLAGKIETLRAKIDNSETLKLMKDIL